MRSPVVAGAISALFAAIPLTPPASARVANLGVVAAIGITNFDHKKQLKKEELAEQSRREAGYRTWYFKKYGYYPDDQQIRDWYVRAYGVSPS